MKKVLYVFSGEKAQGAEIVIERLMMQNVPTFNMHLFIAPGEFGHALQAANKPYKIRMLTALRRLFRSNSSSLSFYFKAVKNHFNVSAKVLRYIKKEGIDIIHANNIMATSYLLPAVVCAKIFFPKTIWLWSDHDIGYESKLDTLISKMALRFYDRTLPVSEAVAKKYSGSKKVEVLYNGLDTNQFKADKQLRKTFRDKFGLPGNAIVIGMAAKVTPGKGHLSLIEVFSNISANHPDAYLLLAGGFADDMPAYGQKVKDAIAANKKILYAGFLEDMPAYYNGCDIIISNSDHQMSESLGTSIYEAMACEKIVVASDTGGTPEIITDKVDGFLFSTGQQDDLQQTLMNAVINYASLEVVKTNAREKVCRKFNIVSMVQNYNRILQGLLKVR